jgi:tetratricopeptide (TPR) repeat protein
MLRIVALFVASLFSAGHAMAIDLGPLWDFSQPAASEQRFRQALANATGDDAVILQTQIARTHGLRQDFARAREILQLLRSQLGASGAQARARYHLELGRTWASAIHAPQTQTPQSQALARQHFETALATAQAGGLDDLAIDAIHMLAFVDTAPADQHKWALAALAVVHASSQPAAQRWEASVRNNLGYALHQLGRFDEALVEFEAAARIRERGTNSAATRVAHWMVAWTLRSLNRIDEALVMQLRLLREHDAAGTSDAYVLEELEALYQAKGDTAQAQHYAQRRQALLKPQG